jgi:general secretion pathway protein E
MLYAPVGCSDCNQLGYRGRTGIYELLIVDEEIRSLIHHKASEEDLVRAMRVKSLQSIRADGRSRILDGITTAEEVLRVTLKD